jgi:hypothetical protein
VNFGPLLRNGTQCLRIVTKLSGLVNNITVYTESKISALPVRAVVD